MLTHSGQMGSGQMGPELMGLGLTCLGIDHIHFFVADAELWRQRFEQHWGLRCWGIRRDPETLTYGLEQGSLQFLVSQALRDQSPVAGYLARFAQGVADVALRVSSYGAAAAHLERLRIPFIGQPDPVLGVDTLQVSLPGGEQGFRHTLVHQGIRQGFEPISSSAALNPLNPLNQWTGIDHVVLNVPVGSLQPMQLWYEQVMGWQPLYRYRVGSADSGLVSVVVGDPERSMQWAINEPVGHSSQIQQFLQANGGSGIQHLALATADIVRTVEDLQQRGIRFLPSSELISGLDPQLRRLGILVDRPDPAQPNREVLQIFTQPIFGDPTFFFEIIQRRNQAQGFGETNFQALFDAIEQQQVRKP